MSKWLLAAASALLAAAACSTVAKPDPSAEAASPTAPKAPASSSTPIPMAAAQSLSITNLYAQYCANCHGANGEGGGGGTKTLLLEEKFEQKLDKPFFDAIKDGVAHMGMEAFGKSLSDEQIWGLVVNIREKQARALRAKNGGPKEVNGVYTGKGHSYRMETVLDKGLRTPWAIDWLPDGRMLVTNRPGGMAVVKNGQIVAEVEKLPDTVELGQGGLMEVAVHPNYAKNGWVYISYAEPAPGDRRSAFTKIVRGKLQSLGSTVRWTDQQTVWQAKPEDYSGAGVHFGDRIVFDGKGNIYFSLGERGEGEKAQDLTKPNGKIHRVKEDGGIPSDNPFASEADKGKGYLASIWSYGHRNPQGLVMGLDGNVYDTEHGPRGGDELNEIKKGANYGWPRVCFSINYNDQPLSTPWGKAGDNFTLPIFRWLPSIGACGLDVVRGAAFPSWKGDLVAGGLSGNNVDRIRVKNGELIEREELVFGQGRVRDVAVGPDGCIYVALNQPDKIIRLVPAK